MPSDPRTRAVAALRFRALGDETRLLLLELLWPGEQCVADLMEATGLGQSLVSHHLRTLRGAGLVHARRDGRWIFYSLVEPALRSARTVIDELERMPDEVQPQSVSRSVGQSPGETASLRHGLTD